MLTRTAQSLLNDCGRIFGPHERRGIVIPVFDVVSDVLGESLDRVEGTAPNRSAREYTEPGFNHVQPGRAGRGEMKVHGRMSLQPRQYFRRLVCGGVVQDDVQISTP